MEKDKEKRMNQLRMEAIGGVIMVTVVIDADGTTSSPFITIVAAPLVATFTPPMKDTGILYTNIWEEMAVERFVPWMDMELAHCPVLGAQEGFVGATTLHPGICYTFYRIPNNSLCLRAT
jgi:hypothetical protein